MLPSYPPSWGFDPRIGWGISLFLGSVASFIGFGVAMRQQERGEPMSRWSRILLVLTFVLFGIACLLLAFGFDVFGRAARAYAGLPPFRQGLLLGACGTIVLELSRLIIWGVYVRSTRRREASSIGEAPPPHVVKLEIVPVEDKDTLYVSVLNLGDLVRVHGLIHPLSGVADWPVSRVLATWEGVDDLAMTIGRGERRRLIIGRRQGNGRRSGFSDDNRDDAYRYLLAFRSVTGGTQATEVPTEWTKKGSYSRDAPQIAIRVTVVMEHPVAKTFVGTIIFKGETWEYSSFWEAA
jgi:hypothetical protein